MAFGIGPRMGGGMGGAAMGAANQFMNQPSQTQQFGNMGADARMTMGGGMPMGNMGNPGMGMGGGMQQPGIGPSNIQELLRKLMTGQQNPVQPGIMGKQMGQGGMPQGLSGMFGG